MMRSMSTGDESNENVELKEEAKGEETADPGDDGDTWVPVEMDAAVRTQITSISNQRLVFFCGAGLSMGNPSSLPSARALVDQLEQEYWCLHGRSLVGEVGNSIEEIAGWALKNAPEFQNFFLRTINSDDFLQPSNPGHRTVADFLIARIAEAALSTNVDYLVEHAAVNLGKARFRGFVTRSHLNRTPDYSPLLKIHGCFHYEEQHTVWCEQQLEQSPIQERVERFQNWMHLNLPGKDLLIIGYWTDWPHLNKTLNRSIQDHNPRSVTLVDPSTPDKLKDKAGGLWEWVNQTPDINFQHVQASGNDFMNCLCRRFSDWFFRRLLHRVKNQKQIKQYYGVESTDDVKLPPLDEMTVEDIYNLRRDFQGVPQGKPATDRDPSGSGYERVGALHQLLMEQSATMEGPLYNVNGDVLRLINGQGRVVDRVKEDFAGAGDKPRGVTAHVCVGSRASLPGGHNIVRPPTSGDDVVRAGQTQQWWTDDDMINYLSV